MIYCIYSTTDLLYHQYIDVCWLKNGHLMFLEVIKVMYKHSGCFYYFILLKFFQLINRCLITLN